MDESIATYKWVLETFLITMMNKKPIFVVTDGDKAMCKCGPVFFTCVPTQWRDSFFISEKLVLEKLEPPLILFYLKRENKIRNKILKK